MKSSYSKLSKWCTGLALLAAAGVMQPRLAQADDLFLIYWRGYSYTTNADGTLSRTLFTEQDYVNKIALDNGLDPATLVMVYRADKRDTAVVLASNGKFIADVIQMEYTFTDVPNAAGNTTVRLAFLYDENHTAALGSACGTEFTARNSSGALVNDYFGGIFQYSYPDQGIVRYGYFATGARVVDTSGAP